MTKEEFISERAELLDELLVLLSAREAHYSYFDGMFKDMGIMNGRELTSFGYDFQHAGGFRTFLRGENEVWNQTKQESGPNSHYGELALGDPHESGDKARITYSLEKEKKLTNRLELIILLLCLVIFALLINR